MVLPKLSMIVGISALSFQAFILYPWHDEIKLQMKALDEKLKILEGNHRKLLPSSLETKIPK